MKLDELIERLIAIRDECNYNAHPYGENTEVDVWWIRDNDNGNEVFKITDIIAKRHMGCDCWTGAEIWVQEEK